MGSSSVYLFFFFFFLINENLDKPYNTINKVERPRSENDNHFGGKMLKTLTGIELGTYRSTATTLTVQPILKLRFSSDYDAFSVLIL